MNNYERIKAMSVDEMAEIFNRKFCEECAYKEMNFNNWQDCDADCWAHIKNGYYKQWLQADFNGCEPTKSESCVEPVERLKSKTAESEG